jgi:hypothetical protein
MALAIEEYQLALRGPDLIAVDAFEKVQKTVLDATCGPPAVAP